MKKKDKFQETQKAKKSAPRQITQIAYEIVLCKRDRKWGYL